MDEGKIVQFPIKDPSDLIEKLQEEITTLKPDIADKKLTLKDEEDALNHYKEEHPDYDYSNLEPRIQKLKNELSALEANLAAKTEELEKLKK